MADGCINPCSWPRKWSLNQDVYKYVSHTWKISRSGGPPTSALHNGQFPHRTSQRSRQDRWKVCPQAHNLRAASPSCNSQMQMGQSSPQQASEPSAPTVKTPGSARMRSAGRPTVCCRDMVPSAAVRLETCPHRDNASASSTKRSWPSECRSRRSRTIATTASPKWIATQTKHKTCHVNKYKYSDSSGRHLGVCAWTSASQKEPRRDQKAKAGTMINHVSQNNA
mmetsp:Transcript_24323/g.61499  ORF Transcript_24323/g.61499 Transcript_24323/m.61499 type:complete len:224 (+) Transcript_24323:342-1013(+)